MLCNVIIYIFSLIENHIHVLFYLKEGSLVITATSVVIFLYLFNEIGKPREKLLIYQILGVACT